MKALKVEDINIGGYETFGDVAARLPRFTVVLLQAFTRIHTPRNR